MTQVNKSSLVCKALSDFVIYTKYSRYDKTKSRRETWEEVVERTFSVYEERLKPILSVEDWSKVLEVKTSVKEKLLLGSMRSYQFGGEAFRQNNARGYNCWGMIIDSLDSLGNLAWLLLSGGGVGFNLHPDYLAKLPQLQGKNSLEYPQLLHTVEDTIEGWADSIKALLHSYHGGSPVIFDYSRIRSKGSPLVTSGGKAPGADGLKSTHEKMREVLDYSISQGQERLSSIDILDLCCHIADAVLSGGVRRSALLASFPFTDKSMLTAKTEFEVTPDAVTTYPDADTAEIVFSWRGKTRKLKVSLDRISSGKIALNWFEVEPQRARANISVCLLRDSCSLEDFKEVLSFSRQWGEPGFIFADSLLTTVNPCAEIGFIPITKDGRTGAQACNLVTLNGVKATTRQEFYNLCELGAIMATIQACFTKFDYLNDASQEITEEEALIGVSINGFFNNFLLFNPSLLKRGAEIVKATNLLWSRKLGINPSARTTCVKPDGTVPFVIGTFASGIHPIHAKKFIRRVRVNKNEPVWNLLNQVNPHLLEDCVYNSSGMDSVVSFPLEVQGAVVTKDNINAVAHLSLIRSVQEHWVNGGTSEFNSKPIRNSVSSTVTVKPSEWDEVANYIYTHRELFSCVSFLPETGDKDYAQAPNEAVVTEEDETRFALLLDKFTPMDFSAISETEDITEAREVLACVGGVCDI